MDLIRRVNRWLVGGTVAAAGCLSLVAAHSFHGHSVTVSGAASSASRGAQQAQALPSAPGGLASPSQAPVPGSPGASAVVSGGS